MKTHTAVMAVLVAASVVLILFAPSWNVSRGFGFLLLICPLMMIGMMAMMGHGKDKHK